MSKYRREQNDDDQLSYAEEMEQSSNEPTLDAEEESYKKRYQDIQRHIQTIRNQKDTELEDVKKQLDAATRKQIKFPKSDEEVDAWSAKYPEVAKIVDTIARKRANEVLAEGEKRLEQVEKFEKSLNKKGAEQTLMQLHPDFAQIRSDPAFHEWVSLQPSALQDSVYKNNTDATWASRTIDLYKSDKGKKGNTRGAAQAVGRTSKSAPSSNNKSTFSESFVSKMTAQEFAQNEEAINESIRSGKFSYDVSGAAR